MNFNDYREVTSTGFKELISLHDSTKEELETNMLSNIHVLDENFSAKIDFLNKGLNELETNLNEKLKNRERSNDSKREPREDTGL